MSNRDVRHWLDRAVPQVTFNPCDEFCKTLGPCINDARLAQHVELIGRVRQRFVDARFCGRDHRRKLSLALRVGLCVILSAKAAITDRTVPSRGFDSASCAYSFPVATAREKV